MNTFGNNDTEDLELTISSWLSHDVKDAVENLGEDIVCAVFEVIDYE